MIVVAIGDRLMVYVKRKTSDDINVPLQRIQNRVLNGEAIKKIKLFLRNDTIFLAVASVVSESNGALRYLFDSPTHIFTSTSTSISMLMSFPPLNSFNYVSIKSLPQVGTE